jgi:hypothetical protein
MGHPAKNAKGWATRRSHVFALGATNGAVALESFSLIFQSDR